MFVGAEAMVTGVAVNALDSKLFPASFTALSKTLYDAPFVRLDIVNTVEFTVAFVATQLTPESIEYSNALMPLPPFPANVNVASSDLLPACNPVKVGASGIVRGMTPDVAIEYGLVPAELSAATLKKYIEPFVNPVIVQLIPIEVGAALAHVPVETFE
jgi:hypothetical protein